MNLSWANPQVIPHVARSRSVSVGLVQIYGKRGESPPAVEPMLQLGITMKSGERHWTRLS
jgi:hypothetical protein